MPCLWHRGILPSSLCTIQESELPIANLIVFNVSPSNSPTQPPVHTNIPLQDICFVSGKFYGDASGGLYSSYPKLIRCGCGLVQITDSGELRRNFSFNLPGPIQTVPRAELYVIVFLVQYAIPNSELLFVTDNQKNKELYCAGHNKCKTSINADLFDIIFKLKEEKHIELTVTWMPSHLKEENPSDIPNFVTVTDIRGNGHADTAAGIAAVKHQVPLNAASKVLYYYRLVKKIKTD